MDTKPTPVTRSLQSRNPSRHDGLVAPKKHDKAKTTVHGCQCAGYMDLRVRWFLTELGHKTDVGGNEEEVDVVESWKGGRNAIAFVASFGQKF